MRKLSKIHYIFLIAILVATVSLWQPVRINLQGHWYGLYLLKGEGRAVLTVQDDLLFGDGSRLLLSIPLPSLHALLRPAAAHTGDESYLDLDWDAKNGSGSLRSVFADHSEMHFYFSRALGDAGQIKHGLFIGGSLPEGATGEDQESQNDSGIAYFDGRRTWHLWCNANEALIPVDRSQPARQTGDWRFLGSQVEVQSPRRVVISSRHAVEIDGIPLEIVRHASFRAGEHFVELDISIRNPGRSPARYLYTYGDEPWLGDYGSSDGNVGWTEAGQVTTESLIDLPRTRYAGMINLNYGLANFIDWERGESPSLGCFSNSIGRVDPTHHRPLTSNERFIGLQWGPRLLRPGEEQSIRLVIGLAEIDPTRGQPHLPAALAAVSPR